MNRKTMACLAAAAVLAMILSGCVQTREVKRACPVDVLALAPFQAGWDGPDGAGMVCPITGQIYRGAKLPPDTLSRMTYYLEPSMEKAHACPLIPAHKVAGKMPAKPDKPGLPVRQALAEAARELGASAVLVGVIYRWQDRVGGPLGVTKPASVYFGLFLINVKTASIMWQAHFDKTQQSLAEDLLKLPQFLSQGAHWLTAYELAKIGLDETVAMLPNRLD